MKKVLLLSCILLAGGIGYTQSSNQSPRDSEKRIAALPNAIEKVKYISEAGSIRGISPYTAVMLLDKQWIDNPKESKKLTKKDFIKKYKLIDKNGMLYANSFLVTDGNLDIEELSAYGVLPGSKTSKISTALIPIEQIQNLSQHENIKYIEIGEPAELTMDNARTVTNVNQVHQGNSLPQPYYGEGVVVGIIDQGFDYTHPNFYDNTGLSNYRVKRVWEQSGWGTPPAGFSYGRELTTQSAMLNAETDFYDQSHGSHVAGIAGGAGGGTTNIYTGAAPKSDLVLVATEGNTSDMIDGINYIKSYAASVGKPCVINLSWGSHVGPHDGSSVFDQSCDDIVDEGVILVGASGNEGNENLFLGKSYTTTDTNLYTFLYFPNSYYGTDGFTYVDIWGVPNQNFGVTVSIYNTSTNQFEDNMPYLYSANYDSFYSEVLYDNDWSWQDPCYVEIQTGIDPLNNKPRALIAIDHTAQDDYYKYVLIQIKGNTTQTKMWANNAEFTDNGYSDAYSGTSNSTMGEIGGTGKNMISVGAFTSKNNWTAYNSSYMSNGALNGAIAGFSSKGPTADNRTKPDIAAPGNVIVSSVNSFDNYYYWYLDNKVVSGVNNSTSYWWFGTMQGTSMAAPMVTGIVALWLQVYPFLTPDQTKAIIKATAITDANTGTIPGTGHNTWGWGKINAWAGIQEILNNIPDTPMVTPNTVDLCYGTATLTAPSGFAGYEWSNNATTQTINVFSPGTYKVKVINNLGYKSAWSNDIVVTDNRPAKPIVTVNGNVFTSNAPSGNQWYINGNAIANATAQSYTATQNGIYKVRVTGSNSCYNESDDINHTTTDINEVIVEKGVKLFPNPANEVVNIKFNESDDNLTINIFDNSGKLVLNEFITTAAKNTIISLDISKFTSGVYILNINGNTILQATTLTIVAK